MRVSHSLILVLPLALGACESAMLRPDPGDDPPTSELRTAPVSIPMAGKTLLLDTYVWRDFQPIAPPDGQPMIAALIIRTTDGSPVPASISVEHAWVVMGNEIWATEPVAEQPRAAMSPNHVVMARNGPKWGPGGTVDVIVRLRQTGGPTRLLRAADQPIHRTD